MAGLRHFLALTSAILKFDGGRSILGFFKRESDKIGERTRPSVDEAECVYAVGDIHGRIDLLDQLIEQILADVNSRDDGRQSRLVFLGDYVDRGDGSRQVLDALLGLSRSGIETEFLMGNHEAALLDFVDDPGKGETWLQMGGLQTLASFGITLPSPVPTASDILLLHSEFQDAISPYRGLIRSMPLTAVSGGVVFCHAGVNPGRSLEDQTPRALLWGHPGALVDEPLVGWRVVHGHFDSLEVVIRPGRICADTGAYYSGLLTCIRLDDAETIIQTVRK